MFMNHPLFAALAAALATQSLRFNRGPRAGQAPAKGLIAPERYARPNQRKADEARKERRAVIKQFGRRQGLRVIRARRAAYKIANEGAI